MPIANYRDRADIRAEIERNGSDTHDLRRVYARADDFDTDFGVVLDDLLGVVLHPTQQKWVRGAYLVLGSVRWWVRGRVEFEVRVEELQGGQGHGLYKRHVAHLLRDKAIQRSYLRENAHLTNG